MNALPFSAPSIDALLAPLEGGAPCGANLEYSPAFKALEGAATGKPEQQFGQTVIAAEEPDWRAVHEQALVLAAQTRDLRVAVMLARAAARVHGAPAYAQALSLVAGLLEGHWEHVHPQLDKDDGNDPTMRVNALLPLADPTSGLADLRSAGFGDPLLPLTVRQLELAAGRAAPHEGEKVPAQEGVVQALAAAQSRESGLLEALLQAHAEFKRIDAALADRLGAGRGPELKPLGALLKTVADAARHAQAGTAAEAGRSVGAVGAAASPTAIAAPGELRSRDDVVRSLERACDWIERNEPSNPAPLLIRRAQRLMNKSFIDIIRDLVPDGGLAQVEKIAGSTGG